jgi:hypothetical protein
MGPFWICDQTYTAKKVFPNDRFLSARIKLTEEEIQNVLRLADEFEESDYQELIQNSAMIYYMYNDKFYSISSFLFFFFFYEHFF